MKKQISINIEDYIPIGHKNAISRKSLISKLNIQDRNIRELISQSPELIVNIGKGYFIVDFLDPKDIEYARQYVSSENARISAIQQKLYKFRGIGPELPIPEREIHEREDICMEI